MTMKIQLKKLVERYLTLESVNDHMDELVQYFTSKPVDFKVEGTRNAFVDFVSEPARYDKSFDWTGDFIDLNEIADSAEGAERVFNQFPEDEQMKFKMLPPNDPIFEPSYKFIDVKEQLPPDTILARFVGDGQFAKVKTNGFDLGTKDMNKLHVPRMYGLEHKSGGGFIYAYEANSEEGQRQSQASDAGQSYGKNAIFFRYPGLKVYNSLDKELQVIVYGTDVDAEDCIFAQGTEDGKFIIENGGFDKSPKTYEEVLNTLKNI